jgi:cell division topological specificity factor
MNLFNYFRSTQQRSSATVAKERLQIIVAHERRQRNNSSTLDYLPLLQQELLAVIRKYVLVEDDQIRINLEKEGNYDILEVNIALPDEPENRQLK